MVAPDDSIEVNALPDAVVALGDLLHLNDISDSNASFRETIQNCLELYNTLTVASMTNKTLTSPTFVTPTTDDLTFTGRQKLDQGADVASGTELTLGSDGNSFDITGTTTVNTILGTSWALGNIVYLRFDGILTVTNNSGGTNDILLGDGTNMTTAAGDILTLQFDGTDWREVSRSVVGGAGGNRFFDYTIRQSLIGGSTRFWPISGSVAQNATEALVQAAALETMTLKKLYIYVESLAGADSTFTTRLAGSDTTLTITIDGTGVFSVAADVAVTAAQLLANTLVSGSTTVITNTRVEYTIP